MVAYGITQGCAIVQGGAEKVRCDEEKVEECGVSQEKGQVPWTLLGFLFALWQKLVICWQLEFGPVLWRED